MSEFSDFQRSLLAFLLLAELNHHPGHGYALAARLAERGFERVKGAKLYPVLSRLESDGYCQPTWKEGEGGPGRKVYTITAEGKAYLNKQVTAWENLHPLVNALLRANEK